MLIRIVEKFGDEAPQHETDGTTIWSGGYSPLDPEEEGLPASSLVDVMPALSVGTWYTYGEFKNLTALSHTEDEDIWTTLKLFDAGVEDTHTFKMNAPVQSTVRSIISSVIGHFDRYAISDRLWIRVE